jgi:hypothetical protein
MKNESQNTNKILLIIIAVGISLCAFFLVDNYLDKQKLKNAIEKVREDEILKNEIEAKINEAELAERKSEEASGAKKNIELLKSGIVCKGSFKPKLHQWIYNNIAKDAVLIITFSEYNEMGINYSPKGVATEDAVMQNLGSVYTRYATQSEIDQEIKRDELLLK